jgi:adenine-specific DNA-methyltransferase
MTDFEVPQPILSAPFAAGEHGQVVVKVVDDRGNELLVVKRIAEAAP